MKRTDTRIVSVTAERFTPCSLARKTNAVALLESASFRSGRQRYSILLVREALRVIQTDQGVQLRIDGKQTASPHRGEDILDTLRYFADQHDGDSHTLPIPFGGVGMCSFEFAALCDDIAVSTQADPLKLPLAEFMLGHLFIVFDHYSDELHVVGINYHEHEIDLAREIELLLEEIHDMNFNYLLSDNNHYDVTWSQEDSRSHYIDMVKHIKREIIAGNLLQAVPSRRVKAVSDLPPFTAYTRLRRLNPSPYLFYLDFGHAQLLGSSPEMHLRSSHRRVSIRPIAGTRRRGGTAAEDDMLAKELLADEKECAEHRMLIDLARNDIGRVCKPKSVVLTQEMEIEQYARVMHIVSEVNGVLADGYDSFDALRATFPAGTVSGAPKINAIKTIAELEPLPRRFYAGVVGYVKSADTLDSCITIRSALKIDSTFYLQAGGGIVYDSEPEREFEETNEKLQSLIDALNTEPLTKTPRGNT